MPTLCTSGTEMKKNGQFTVQSCREEACQFFVEIMTRTLLDRISVEEKITTREMFSSGHPAGLRPDSIALSDFID